jgi:CBS domain-containing protein/sporulation protein YlmC with PRC-barrel domain
VTITNVRVFVARLAGTEVFDPHGDLLGKVRDVVVSMRAGKAPIALGLVIEVPPRRRIFLPMGRVTSIEPGQVITTGKLDITRFRQRDNETLCVAQLLDRTATVLKTNENVSVGDLSIEFQPRTRDWQVGRIFVRKFSKGIRRYGESMTVTWDELSEFSLSQPEQPVDNLLEQYSELRAPDLANALRDLPEDRRLDVARELDDERLADVLEELAEDVRVELVQKLGVERAADVIEEMDTDDAADLLKELPDDAAQEIIEALEPEDAEELIRLVSYGDYTAGGMMTTEPVMILPDATVAEALARVRNPEISPALASQVYVVRSPLETPTGKYLGVAHIQRLLREPPSTLVSAVIDKDLEPIGPLSSLAAVARYFATYNLVALPVVDEAGRLLGAVTVDDLVDHMLPEDWRQNDGEEAADVS